MLPLMRAVRSERGFSLIWSLVYVVILASLVSTALIWSRYALRMGGLGQIWDERNESQSQAAFDQAALQAMQLAAQQARISTIPSIDDLKNVLQQQVFPALQNQQMLASVVYTYQVSWNQQYPLGQDQLNNFNFLPHAVIQVQSLQGGYSAYYNVTYALNVTINILPTFQWVLQITPD